MLVPVGRELGRPERYRYLDYTAGTAVRVPFLFRDRGQRPECPNILRKSDNGLLRRDTYPHILRWLCRRCASVALLAVSRLRHWRTRRAHKPVGRARWLHSSSCGWHLVSLC